MRKRGIVTKGDLSGTACSEGDYTRFKIIACGKTLNECTYEWCDKYKHEWRKYFGACILKGCPAEEMTSKEAEGEEGPPAKE